MHNIHLKILTNLISPEIFYDKFREATNSQLTDEIIEENWNLILKDFQKERMNLLTDLSALTEEKNQLIALLNPVQFDETERNNFSKQLTEVEERLSQINVRMVSLKFEREDLAAQMEDLEHHNQDFIQQTQELNTKKTRYEMQLEQIEGQLMTLQETLNS